MFQRALLSAFLAAWLLAAGIARAQGGAAAPVDLTSEERAWLRAHPTIRVGYDPDFKPFCFRDAAGNFQGIDADLLALLGRRLGIRFEPHSAASWTQVYASARRGELELLASTASIPERQEHFLFTRDYVRFPVTIVTRSDGPFAVTATDLQAMRVAGARNYAPTLAFRRTYPGVSIQEFDKVEEALLMVVRDRADAVVTNLANASYIIKTSGFTSLKIAGVVPGHFELRFAVQPAAPELRSALDKALATLSEPELASILDRWIKVDYAAVIRWDVVRRWAIIGALFAATVIGLVSWRNRSLARELARRAAVQRSLEAANAELAARHEEKSELMRIAAHDLRGPLTGIVLHTELLADSPAAASAASSIREAARHMTRLVEDLLDVHALEEGRREFRYEEIDLGELLRAAAASHAAVAQKKRIAIEAEALAPLAPVRADPGALRQVFDNLLTNAIKFSPSDRRVSIRLHRWDNCARAEVCDEGPGVPPAERERIFVRYRCGSARPTAGEPSTGLGLAIVRELLAAMNGRVWCEDRAEGGARFIVVLPFAAHDSR